MSIRMVSRLFPLIHWHISSGEGVKEVEVDYKD